MKKMIAFLLSEIAEIICFGIQMYDDLVTWIKIKYPKLGKHLKQKIFLIRGTGEESDQVYLKRYVVWYSERNRVYLHRFLSSDKRGEWHSHPWSASFLHLRNTYKEEVLVNHPHIDQSLQEEVLKQGFGWFKVINCGRELLQVTTIDRSHIHRVELDKSYHDCPSKAPLTLAWSGKRCYTKDGVDDWGFWKILAVENHRGIGIPLYFYTNWKDATTSSLSKEIKASH